MIEVDDLVEPRAEQILLAGLPPLLRSHDAPSRADSGEGGQAFHLKADSDSGRSRTAFR
jgi:hypothetical protein